MAEVDVVALQPCTVVDLTNPSSVHIDHSVALAEAWPSGADSWTQERRKAFAKDTTPPDLMVLYAPANSRESDHDVTNPYGRPRGLFGCFYARAVIAVKSQWALRVQAAEKEELQTMLNACPYA
ncbi:hypothetical protein GKE82_24210 [Conexibacter sp. W3-3-2]|uniref:GmrSD restriction endonuclease domain-containing protein n=1 Tax=Conexibacter sp. W3-3-2 TaxID=2675227 RepID=UPI0012B73113|nr:DUF1524 domain-containing protein [Conexibacter sp. W3-3-2]MTD47313.1 hypothetical protein [Conexibacter sp. W3-3-2]